MLDSEKKKLYRDSFDVELDEAKLRSLKLKRWLKTDETALYLGRTSEAIKKLRQRGKLSPKKFCGKLYFDREMLDQLIENSDLTLFNSFSRYGVSIPSPRRKK